MKLFRIISIISFILMLSVMQVQAGSIWAKATDRMKTVYADDTAGHVGDLITIKIDERSALARGTNRKMDKNTGRDLSMAGSIKSGDDIGKFVGFDTFNFSQIDYNSSSKSTFDGNVEVDADRSFTDEITATVEDVLPNGNLLVVGRRIRKIIGEEQVMQVSGVIRKSDIAFDNTIDSTKVADFNIDWKTYSHEDTYTNPGWLTYIGNILNPF